MLERGGTKRIVAEALTPRQEIGEKSHFNSKSIGTHNVVVSDQTVRKKTLRVWYLPFPS